MEYFKPTIDALLAELKYIDWWTAQKLEYINSTGVWLAFGLSVLERVVTDDGLLEGV